MSHLYKATKFDNGNDVLVPEINYDRDMMTTINKNNCKLIVSCLIIKNNQTMCACTYLKDH